MEYFDLESPKELLRTDKNISLILKDYQSVRDSLFLFLRNRNELVADFDYIHIDMFEDLRLCLFHVEVADSYFILSPIPSECLTTWGQSIESVIECSADNTQRRIYFTVTMIIEGPQSEVAAYPFNSDQDLDELEQRYSRAGFLLLQSPAILEGAVGVMLPKTQDRLARLTGGDFYASFIDTDTAIIQSTSSIDAELVKKAVLAANNATGGRMLSKHPLRFNSRSKALFVVK